MGKPRTYWASRYLAVICLAASTAAIAQGTPEERFPCEIDPGGQNLESEELGRVLREHEIWLASRPGSASVNESMTLCGANLIEASLVGKNLSRANLRNSDLQYADLSHSSLTNADLRGADLRHTNLSEADLTEADLTGADLIRAKLVGARVTRAIFEPETLPDPVGFLRVRGLSEIRFSEQVSPLVKLRDRFRASGFRSQEREITAALARYKLTAAPANERFFQRYIAGGRITDYGANPWGTLKWLGIFLFLFFWPYLLALRSNEQKNGIWWIRSKDRVLRKEGEAHQELVPYRGLVSSITLALYFSILSAFHFGWRELNLGNWIVRLQFHESTLKATGWVRTVSGLQSLISLYLVALFLISYFGDPFS